MVNWLPFGLFLSGIDTPGGFRKYDYICKFLMFGKHKTNLHAFKIKTSAILKQTVFWNSSNIQGRVNGIEHVNLNVLYVLMTDL